MFLLSIHVSHWQFYPFSRLPSNIFAISTFFSILSDTSLPPNLLCLSIIALLSQMSPSQIHRNFAPEKNPPPYLQTWRTFTEVLLELKLRLLVKVTTLFWKSFPRGKLLIFPFLKWPDCLVSGAINGTSSSCGVTLKKVGVGNIPSLASPGFGTNMALYSMLNSSEIYTWGMGSVGTEINITSTWPRSSNVGLKAIGPDLPRDP